MRSGALKQLTLALASAPPPGTDGDGLGRVLRILDDWLPAMAWGLYRGDEDGWLRRERCVLGREGRLRDAMREAGVAEVYGEAGMSDAEEDEESERAERLGLLRRIAIPADWSAPESRVPLVANGTAVALVLAPLQRADDLCGALGVVPPVSRRSTRRIRDALRQSGGLLSWVLAPLLERNRLRNKLRQAEERARAEQDALASAVDARHLMTALLGLAAQATHFDGAFYATRGDDGVLRVHQGVGLPQAFPREGEPIGSEVIQVEHLGASTLVTSGRVESLTTVGVQRLLALPVTEGERMVGVTGLVAAGTTTAPTRGELDVLGGYTRQIELLVQKEREAERFAQSYLDSLRMIADGLDMLSPTTRGHSQRVSELVEAIADQIPDLTSKERESLRRAAPIHDVGLFPGTDAVLSVSAEFRHPTMGGELVALLPGGEALARVIAEHHETWDGVGFPAALQGDEISICGQVLGAAEYVAELTSDGPMRDGLSFGEAAARCAGEARRRFSATVAAATAEACRELSRSKEASCD